MKEEFRKCNIKRGGKMKLYQFKKWENISIIANNEEEARTKLNNGEFERDEVFGEDLIFVGGDIEE